MKKVISVGALLLLLSGVTFAAFTAASKNYAVRSSGNVRTFLLTDTASTNGNSTSIYLTSPASIYIEMFGGVSGFGSGTHTLTYSVDNGVTAFAALVTATVACTADCVKFVAAADVKSGYYRVERTGSAAAYNVVTNLIATGSVDAQ